MTRPIRSAFEKRANTCCGPNYYNMVGEGKRLTTLYYYIFMNRVLWSWCYEMIITILYSCFQSSSTKRENNNNVK